jgi:predicted nuclease with RNAse H fold
VTEPVTVAIDWSGAVSAHAQRRHICIATVRPDGVPQCASGMTREEIVAMVAALPPPVVVGFDFSFGLPAWFARDLGCTGIDDVWAAAATHEHDWLHDVAAPFWGRGARPRCDLDVDRRFRACELELHRRGLPAKSVFQLVGNGQVGAGSVRGMALLPRLRDAGFAIWPFDDAGDRTVVEIYPRAFRDRGRVAPLPDAAGTSRDAFDASISGSAMFEHRHEFRARRAATDAVTRIEGNVWLP